jgi:hypothetical protein
MRLSFGGFRSTTIVSPRIRLLPILLIGEPGRITIWRGTFTGIQPAGVKLRWTVRFSVDGMQHEKFHVCCPASRHCTESDFNDTVTGIRTSGIAG